MSAEIKITLYDYCQRAGNTKLLEQWNTVRNGDVTPNDVSASAHRKVWWRCDKGHEWEALIKSRSQGSGCPVCANKLVVPRVNDLATTHPNIAAQWHPTKNGALSPEGVSRGTKRKVWWICGKGHEWEASVLSRSQGSGCPYSSGKSVKSGENDLVGMYPQIAAQWHPTKNGNLRPDAVTPQSNRKVWWVCDRGHEFQSLISHRTARSSGCPYCAGTRVLAGFNDLATVYPKIAAQWHPTLNEGLSPDMVVPGSTKKVWWQCSEGHVWKTVVYSRTGPDKCGCPICAGKMNRRQMEKYADIIESKTR